MNVLTLLVLVDFCTQLCTGGGAFLAPSSFSETNWDITIRLTPIDI